MNIIEHIYMYLHDNHRKWFDDKFGPGTGGIGVAFQYIIIRLAIFLLVLVVSVVTLIVWLI